MLRANPRYRLGTLPEDKGTRFAADSPENALHEKISEKFCGGSSGGEFRLKISYMGP
jgi:hypothetical protein